MRRLPSGITMAAIMLLFSSQMAWAWHIQGRVFCEGSGLPLGDIQVNVTTAGEGCSGFSASTTTDADGFYFTALPDVPCCFRATVSTGPDESVVSPAGGEFLFCTQEGNAEFVQDWVIASPRCANERCWLTGGGARFSSITGAPVGEALKANKLHNFGGNVNPGCNTDAGQGGEWNDIDAGQKLHFKGTAIQVVRCGNVDGIPAGSTSPVTPFNFIEFQGTGTLKGIKGNKADYGTVYFFGRCEDRNEPGSNGQRDGAGKDRYFLHVYSNPADPTGSTLLLVDQDADPSTVDPLVITDGNLQIHISSCNTPPATSSMRRSSIEAARGAEIPANIWLAAENPIRQPGLVRFGLPRDAEVSLRLYDVTGRAVRELASGRIAAGEHQASWDLRDRSGVRVASGLYFLRLAVDGVVQSRHIVVAP